MPVLAELREVYPMAVVSNKPDIAVKVISGQLIPGFYGVGEVPGTPRKPSPDKRYTAMKEIGVERCIYIGDSEEDVATARNAGVPCISVLWGFRSKEELINAGATHFCQTPADLPALIKNLTATLDGN